MMLRLHIAAGAAALSAAAHALAAAPLPPLEHTHRHAPPSAKLPAARTSDPPDPHLWLEEVEGADALSWCQKQNERVVRALGDPAQTEAYRRILAIADSQDKIAYVQRIGGKGDCSGWYYNFWQDAQHVRGVWRRTTLDSYRSASPEWHTVISLDEMNRREGRADGDAFVWAGHSLLDEGAGGSKWDRTLLFLSPGGTDAKIVREFDLLTCAFVDEADGGFVTHTAAKCDVGFRRRDEVLIGTDFDGEGGSLTDSGYPRVIKSWIRGTPLSSATTVFEVGAADVSGSQYAYHDRGVVHEWRLRSISFYQTEQWHRHPDLSKSAAEDGTPFVKLQVPDDASVGTFGAEAIVELRSAWAPPNAPDGKAYPAGSLLAAPMADVLRSDWRRLTPLFEPSADGSTSLQGMSATRNYLVLETSEHVRSNLRFWRYHEGDRQWAEEHRGGGGNAGGDDVGGEGAGSGGSVPVGERVSVSAVWPDDSDALWLTRSGFLSPTSLELASAADGCASAERLKSMPSHFDATGLECTQHFATSADGTRVPYFMIAPKDLPMDGSSPTLLDGYGGFEISMTPHYSGSVGAAWLSKGGVKVIANIRGGGEYGPAWHQAALRERRHKAYEDFEAVAEDLIARGVTSVQRLGAIGGSNGGLLMGNMITRKGRSLFGAVVCQVPLLDMRRYHTLLAGASWMEEFGNPDEEGVWEAYLESISPYHRLRGAACLGSDGAGAGSSWAGAPRTLFTTSTKDDRVHPGHARKMVKALVEEVPPELGGGDGNCHYWENIEGGHGGAADNKQRAYMWALSYNLLWQVLAVGNDASSRSTPDQGEDKK